MPERIEITTHADSRPRYYSDSGDLWDDTDGYIPPRKKITVTRCRYCHVNSEDTGKCPYCGAPK